ncbi:molybdenum cofactor guanylyltransferase [Siphonobacter sp. BAB-5405]|uniref:NTP transferase domain-containing protein n=1 Tax=Siphonobacter sp. BAB-5405 TaxID=1864825 RepID=UPI000C804417|nr:NTP transferase domain-containing protein [Siphonobacter sp. BAB-5405]PMD97326.1 molybdenum cofactor guanylyltransferase [Siphonobacter sp. BAB-5405]
MALLPDTEVTPPLWGLVLGGGQSTRMGTDKAWLQYGNQPQWKRAYECLQRYCECVYVSVNPEQQRPSVGNYQIDSCQKGPMGGLLTAFGTNSSVAWLVLAVDMPLVQHVTLESLVQNRNPASLATAFAGADALPEPLVTIYEPRSFSLIRLLFEKNHLSLRKFLTTSDVTLLCPPQPSELISVDTPEAYRYWKEQLASSSC